MQREDVLGEALKLLEIQGIANTTPEMVAERIDYPLDELQRFWPDKEAILYDALRYLSQKVDIWRRQLMLDETLSTEQKLLARYQALSECVSSNASQMHFFAKSVGQVRMRMIIIVSRSGRPSRRT